MTFETSCSSCKHLALPDQRAYYAADSETREQMLDDVWCLRHDSEPAPGVAGCPEHEPAKLVVVSSASCGSGDWFYDYARAKGHDIEEQKRWPAKWEHPGWQRMGAEEGE
jgi:hypothetical protein